jgi:hypothetical protein
MSEGIPDNDPYSFADLGDIVDSASTMADSADGGEITSLELLPPRVEGHSGIVTLSSLEIAARALVENAEILQEENNRIQEESEMEAMIKEQQGLHALYTDLMDTTNLFVDPLITKKNDFTRENGADVDVLADSQKLRMWLSVYMNQIKEILIENHISSQSNLVKLIDGIEQEFETILSYGERNGTLYADVVKAKMGDLTRVLSNLCTALLTHRNECARWEEFDSYVPELLGVAAADLRDMDDLTIAFDAGSTHEEIMTALPELKDKIEKSAPYKTAKLAQYAEGNLSIYGINEEKAAWDEAQKILRKLKRTGPKKVE